MLDDIDYERRIATAHQRTYDARQLRDQALRQVKTLQAQIQNQAAIRAAADELVAAALALPDVVRTHRLRQAISEYRKAKQHDRTND